MDFNWNEPKTIDEQEFSTDNLDRAKYATYLTSLIKAKGGTEKNNLSNYVLNLDAEWGAGKTYFLKRWSEDLKGNHPVVYIDAWAIDYLEAPLMTVLSEIIEQLKLQTDKLDPDETQRKLNGVIKAAAPRIGSALMKRYLGFDFNIFDSAEPEDGTFSGSGKEVDFSKAGEKVLEVFCKEVTDSKESVKTLKLAIQSWVEYVVEHPVNNMNTIKNSYPAFIFIDELDRCKPTYAVEMLEAIKHVFDIPGLAFVVATNTTQLSHTVKAVYGSEFNAEVYLSRFFDNKYYMRSRVSEGLLLSYYSQNVFDLDNLVGKGVVLFPFFNFNTGVFLKLCSDVFNELNIPPRQSIKIIHRLELVISTMRGDITLDLPLLLCLITSMEMGQSDLESLLFQLKTAQGTSNSKIYSALAKVNFNIDINIGEARGIFNHIPNNSLEYENSNGSLIGGGTSVSTQLSLADYLFKYKREAIKNNYQNNEIYNEIAKVIEETQANFTINSHERSRLIPILNKKRLELLFSIFNNDSNFDFYQELVEMSANLE
jgi:hypothetical protein